jgi:hypothetical protein
MSRGYRSDGVVSEESAGSFLEHLLAGTPEYYYNKQCAMETIFPEYSVEDRLVVLKQFPPETFAEHEEQLLGRYDYSPSLQILIITIPSEPHEAASSMFEEMMTKVTQEMRVNRRIAPRRATFVKTPGRRK